MGKNPFGEWQAYLPENIAALAMDLAERAEVIRSTGTQVFPPQDRIFRALQLTAPCSVKAVIVGQDPYHGIGQANGLAFSVNDSVPFPPSLRNIFKELDGCSMPTSGDLTPWANRGVLLLNSVLTVEAGKPASHAAWNWQSVVAAILSICMELPQPTVFLLWGRFAISFAAKCGIRETATKRLICSSHPSPLGASKPCGDAVPFVGSKPFAKANALLREMGAQPIDWQLN